MKGVLLCGGMGSRLAPITRIINKNLLPVGQKPLVYHCLEKFREAGITKILLTCGSNQFGQIVELLGSGNSLGVELTYRVQEKALGISDAIRLAEDFVNNEPFVVMLGDNIFENSIAPLVQAVNEGKSAYVAVKSVPDPQRFGVVKYRDGEIEEIVEKPQFPPSNDAVIGVYGYQGCAFDKIRKLRPSARGELEVSDLNNMYLAEGRLQTIRMDGFWIDAGTHSSMHEANNWFWEKANGTV